MQKSSTRYSSKLAVAMCLASLTFASPSALAQQCPDGTESSPESCDGPIESALSQARSNFADSCPGLTVRDCDRINGGWQCSSAVIGDNAPGGVTSPEACEEEITPVAQLPTSAPEPPPPAQEPEQISEPVESGPVELVIGLSDAERYGHRYPNANRRLTLAAFTFDGGSEILTLTVTGHDIDYADEVAVLVNGDRIGYLSTSPNNGTAVTSLPINLDNQRTGTNTLEFREKTSGWRWGVTDIMLTFGCNYPLVQN